MQATEIRITVIRSTACLALLAAAMALVSCGGGGSGATANRVPINTGTGWSDSPFISRDGQRLYFMYSRYNFGPWLLSGGTVMPVASGPDRPGLHQSSNPFDESDIYVATKRANGTWSEPVNLGLNGAYGDSSGMEIDGGNSFIWLRGTGSSNNIVMATRNPDNSWGAVVDLGTGINESGVIQDNPHLSADGNALWFTSSRTGGLGGKDIWFSSYSGSSWSAPVNMGAPFNSADDEDQMWISPAGDVYWNSLQGLMYCLWNGSTCSAAPEVVTIPGCDFAAEASMPDNGQTLYFACANLTTGMVSIMYSSKQTNGSWGTATPVD